MRNLSLSSLALMLSTSFAYTAAPTKTVETNKPNSAATNESADLLKQIEDLKHRVAQIAHKQKVAEENAAKEATNNKAKSDVLAAKTTSDYPENFIPVPNTNTAMRFGGRIKIDGSYNAGPLSDKAGAFLNVRSIPLKGTSTEERKQGHFGATAQSSRLFVDSLTRTSKGDLTAFIRFDFYGPQNGGVFTTGNNGYLVSTGSTTQNSSDYGLRLRQAVVQFANFRIGQDESNFADFEMAAYHLENFGIGVLPRRAQLRYTHAISKQNKISFSIEKPNTDYVDSYGSWRGNDGFGKSSLPDVTVRFRTDGDMGFFSVGAIWRTLTVSARAGENYANSYEKSGAAKAAKTIKQDVYFQKNGWGISVGARLNKSKEKSHAFGQFMYGHGLGYLAQDSNPSGYFQFLTSADSGGELIRYQPTFDLIKTTNVLFGYCHYWSENFRTTIAGTYTRMKHSNQVSIMTGGTQINQQIKRLMINGIYNPVKNVDVGLEIMHATRETVSGYSYSNSGSTYYGGTVGRSTQVTTSFIYRF